MSKEIKPIICPQCGSTDKQNLKDEHYRCANCRTEYYLDDDDIHIIHYHKDYDAGAVSRFHSDKNFFKTKFSILILVFLTVSFLFYNSQLFTPFQPNEVSNQSKPMDTVVFSDRDSFLYKNTENVIRVLVLGLYKNKQTEQFELYAKYYNKEGKLDKKQTFERGYSYSDRVEFKQTSSGNIYAVVNQQRVFKLDKDTERLEDITPSLEAMDELNSGIVTIESYTYKDYIKILDRSGKSFYYYPDLEVIEREEKLPNTLVERELFAFEDVNSNDSYRLLKYKQKGTVGAWGDAYLSDWLRAVEEHKSQAIKKEEKRLLKHYHIESVVNFTPGRYYFLSGSLPRVLYSNTDIVIILYSLSLNDHSPQYIQMLDANSAQPLVTVDVSKTPVESLWYPDEAVMDNEDIVVLGGRHQILRLDKKTGAYKGHFSAR